MLTVLMYAAPLMGMPKMDMAGMLGTMFVSKKETATVLGMVMHFVAGVVFAIVYALLWTVGLGSPTWFWGLIFGAVHGIIAIAMMPILMRMHPRAPEMEGGPRMMAGQLMGHLVYGLVVALVYAAF